MTTKKGKASIEELYEKLRKMVEGFEREEISLEESVTKLKEGLKLAEELKKRLTALKNEVEEIMESQG